MADWREKKNERVIVRGNAILFLRQGLIYKEFCLAMSYEDILRIPHVGILCKVSSQRE